ncbi:MAG: hypothetical protein AB2784_11370 [Candidatus Thiodiazotropha endolucinida]
MSRTSQKGHRRSNIEPTLTQRYDVESTLIKRGPNAKRPLGYA